MLPTLVIFFREALEASLIVGILLAYVRRVGRPEQARPLWWGVAVAVALDLALALALYHAIRQYDGSRLQVALEGTTYLVATGVLTYMSFWMKGQSRGLRAELEARAQSAIDRGSLWAMGLLAGVTVGREGLETAFFTLAIAFQARPWALLTGAVAGLFLGLGVTYWVYRLGRHLPLGAFFNVLGVLLLLFGAGLLADGVEDYQSLGWLPFATRAVWHTGRLLREDSTLGDILHSFFGYAASPSELQVAAYALFLALALAAYLRAGRPGRTRRQYPLPG